MKANDLTNQRFGKLIVKGKDNELSKIRKRSYWICDCDCGTNHKSIAGSHLTSGNIISCGCYGKSIGGQRFEDLSGQIFDRLVVIKRVQPPQGLSDKQTFFECKCECGKTKIIRAADLKNGKVKSCGCLNIENLSNRAIDLSGQKFGKLTVICRDKSVSIGENAVHWICKCECGNIKSINGSYLRNGETKSCGCLQNENLIGQKFGRLTVKSLDNSLYRKGRYWICECDCGNVKSVSTTLLKKGCVQSCGCIRAKDLTNEKYGMLTVLYRDFDSELKSVHWICKCECGNIKSISANALCKGQKSCGCLKGGAPKIEVTSITNNKKYRVIKDITHQKYGMLTVIGFDKIMNNKSRWHCRCECGNKKNILLDNLLNGNAISCGCYKKKQIHERCFKDITGETFGDWTVLKHDNEKIDRNGKYPYWVCKCRCGNVKSIVGATLRNGMSTSCGCSNKYRLETWIEEIINDYEFDYKKQMTFDNLKGIKNGTLSYDFGLFEDDILICLIECQGKQHYESIDYFGGKEKFEAQVLNDIIKKEFAEKELQIPLFEVPYSITKMEDMICFFEQNIYSKI